MDYDDIEMLEVPDDLSMTLETQTESELDPIDTPVQKKYPSLEDFLTGESLPFQFDLKTYLQSAKKRDLPEAQKEYITQLYKILEDVASKTFDDDEPIGVITSSKDIGGSSYKAQVLSTAYAQLMEQFNAYRESVGDDFDDLASILACLEAKLFTPERLRPEQILRWINEYDPQPDNDFIDSIIYNTPEPYLHPQFWTDYMGTILSRGMFAQAEQSLRSSRYEQLKESCPALHAIIEDLITIVGSYLMALKGQFPEWKHTVCEMRDSFQDMKAGITEPQHSTIASQIHRILNMLSGLAKTTAGFVSLWYEMYGALALFQVRDDETVYADYLKLALAEKGMTSSPTEEVFKNILLGNFLRVVLAINKWDPPTAAYVSRLIELTGGLDLYIKLDNRSVSDYLLIRHAYECLELQELVPVGVGLFMAPIVHAQNTKDVLAEFLPHYVCFTNDDLEWALTLCAKLGLPKVAKQLYLSQGQQSLESGHLFEAMSMFVECYDENGSKESAEAMAQVHRIVWESLFQDALLNSLPVDDETIGRVVGNDPSIKVHPIIRLCIAPYAVLAEFFMEAADPDCTKNLARLNYLSNFKHMPRKFKPLLMAQYFPFLRRSAVKVPQLILLIEALDLFEDDYETEVKELYEYAVENVPTDLAHDWRAHVAPPATVEELLRELRTQIARELGKAYIGK